VNINLHVGRAHSEYLNLPSQPRVRQDGRHFTPALVEAQKAYARDCSLIAIPTGILGMR